MSIEKLKALIHFVVASCEDPHRLGATKLNKILWFSDTFAYRANGASISGVKYVKRQRGPVPAAVLAAIRELESEGKIHVREKEMTNYKIRLFQALEEADTSLFSQRDMEIVKAVVADICLNHTATSISDLSHDQIWGAAAEGEELPLYATLASQAGEVTAEIMTWADDVVLSVESNLRAA